MNKKKSNNDLSDREKILLGMDKVYENLMAYKKRLNSDIVVCRKGKIMHISPE